LALWQAVSWLAWAPPTLLPSPIQVAEVLKDGALDGSLWVNLGVSFRRVAAGYLLGAGFGLAFGAILGFSAAVDEYVGATLDAFQQVPLYGWIPLIILLVGIDEGGKIAFVALGSFTPVFVNAREGLRQVDRRHLEVAAVYGYGRWQTFWRVAAPAAAPMVMTGLRIGLGYAWMAVVGAELLGATRGVGYLITWSRMLFQSDGVLAGVVLVALVGYLLDRALAALERRISRWRDAHGRP
jgi:sulfonate transport system permease protein